MTCEELITLVTAYLDGVLTAGELADFEAHLAECPGCERYVDQFRGTLAPLGELPPAALSDDARDRLLAAFADWRGGEVEDRP